MFNLFTSRPQPTERFCLAHQGRQLDVILRRRSNARRLTMRLRDGEISLTTPQGITAAEAEAFIIEHFDWVEHQLIGEEIQLQQMDGNVNGDGHGGGQPSIWYKGVLTPVILRRDPRHKGRTAIRYHHDRIVITMASGSTSRLRPAALLEDWLKKQAKKEIQTALAEILPLIDEAPVPITIRDQKTRWGSCSTTRRLSFNWRLVMAPPEALHYVVVHEAAHLIHHNHSKRFWGLVEEMMPDFSIHQKWLKKHQQALFTGIDRRLAGLEPSRSRAKKK
jgi:predicted metal-dependent hydrolase